MRIEPNLNDKPQSASLLQIVEPSEVNRRMSSGNTFVVNVVATWCPDCTQRQKLYTDSFAKKMGAHKIEVLQVDVQLTKGVFISPEHEQMTALFGGHGYPRTVLINHGNVASQDNVEIIAEDTLSELASKFIQIISES